MSGFAVQLKEVCSISVPQTANLVDVVCGCDFSCSYKELVFADNGTDDYKKDLSSGYIALKIQPV